jgi:hypothetical protein
VRALSLLQHGLNALGFALVDVPISRCAGNRSNLPPPVAKFFQES